jgi:hypothetical protein
MSTEKQRAQINVKLLKPLIYNGKIDFEKARDRVRRYKKYKGNRGQVLKRLDKIEKVYKYLNKNKNALRDKLSKDINLNRSTAYSCLYILEELNLVERSVYEPPTIKQRFLNRIRGNESRKKGRPPVYWKVRSN